MVVTCEKCGAAFASRSHDVCETQMWRHKCGKSGERLPPLSVPLVVGVALGHVTVEQARKMQRRAG